MNNDNYKNTQIVFVIFRDQKSRSQTKQVIFNVCGAHTNINTRTQTQKITETHLTLSFYMLVALLNILLAVG